MQNNQQLTVIKRLVTKPSKQTSGSTPLQYLSNSGNLGHLHIGYYHCSIHMNKTRTSFPISDSGNGEKEKCSGVY